MSFEVIKQPDGKLAIFSSELECWVRWDMTPKKAARWFARRAYAETLRDVLKKARLVAADAPAEAYGRTYLTDFASANARSSHYGGPVLDGPVDEALIEELVSFLDNPDA